MTYSEKFASYFVIFANKYAVNESLDSLDSIV